MATAVILGADGKPARVTSSPGDTSLDLSKVDKATLDSEIAKRVRSQGASITQVWDPRRGKPKPTSVTFTTLRMMSVRNEWIAAIIKTRKNQIGKVKWSIKPKDEDDGSPGTKKLCEQVTELFRRPSMYGSRPNSRSWRQFIGEVLQDLLALDAACIEKERNGRKWIVAMYPVDGATIQPNIDERGGYHDDAYVQIVDGQVTARFGMEDLVYIMDNPQTDVRYAGYGFSPLEQLIVSVTAELYASKYNASYFEKGSVPEGMINLGEDVAPEDVDAFRLYWMNEIMGKPWSIPILGGKGVEWIPWRMSNKDMEYSAYNEWLLKKMCALYQIAPQEIGMIEDVNRSTAEEQQESNSSKSIEPILTLLEDFFEVEIIGQHGLGVADYIKFEFDKEDQNEQWELQKWETLVNAGAGSRNEMREAVGEEPRDEEGADMLLVAGQLNPLPTKEDAELLSAKGQADQQQQQMDAQNQMNGVGSGTMPWKPANPNDPKFQDEKAGHDMTSGTGPREEPQQQPFGKSFLDGKRPVQSASGRTLGHTLHSTLSGKWEAHHVDHGFLGEHPTEGAARSAVIAAHRRGVRKDAVPATHSCPGCGVGVVQAGHRGFALAAKAGPSWNCPQCKTDWRPVKTRPMPNVSKGVPWDRNPALTDVHDDLEDVLADAQDELLNTIERLTGIPVREPEPETT